MNSKSGQTDPSKDAIELLRQHLRDQEAEVARLRARSEKDAAMLRKCRQFVAWATERLPEAVPVYDELNAHLGGENV